jgi:hypothetical protein
MKERPILFSGAMVKALLAGRKTQTRRVLFNQRAYDLDKCPYGQPGDRLWVRETWQHSNHPYGPYDEDCMVFYRADFLGDVHGPDGEKSSEGRYRFWRPSIHMPRVASRLTLEITGVRVERLQEISDADCIAEGTPGGHGAIPGYLYNATPLEHYHWLWNDINGRGAWEINPWVWVLKFRVLAPSASI